jgi:hypothetical protein
MAMVYAASPWGNLKKGPGKALAAGERVMTRSVDCVIVCFG